jgi:hypothetical protein
MVSVVLTLGTAAMFFAPTTTTVDEAEEMALKLVEKLHGLGDKLGVA